MRSWKKKRGRKKKEKKGESNSKMRTERRESEMGRKFVEDVRRERSWV